MPLEDLTGPDKFLDALNTAWPLDDDDRPEGDNHIRGIKNVLVNQFGSLSAFVDLLKSVQWNEQADGEPLTTGSQPSPVGTIDQRPASPNSYDYRWITGQGPAYIEHYIGGEWKAALGQLNYPGQWTATQYYQPGTAASPALRKSIGWSDAADWARRLAAFDITVLRDFDDASGGDAEFWLETLVDGTLKTMLKAAAAGLSSDHASLTLDGKAVLKGDDAVFVGAEQALSTSGERTWTHGLSYTPRNWSMFAVCKVIDNGWRVGDEFDFSQVTKTNDTQNNQETSGYVAYADDTQVGLAMGPRRPWFPHRTSGSIDQMAGGAWNVFPVVWG